MTRLTAIDRMRGLVMALMALDHAGTILVANKLQPDSAWWGHSGTELLVDGSPLPFLTRWITHLCAPTFVFLAGTSIALRVARSTANAAALRDVDRHLLARGALLIGLELWMAIGFGVLAIQVLYAIGLSMICLAALRRLPTAALVALAGAILLASEGLIDALGLDRTPFVEQPLWAATTWTLGYLSTPALEPLQPFTLVLYPLLPWLAIMLLGFTFGRFLAPRGERAVAGQLALAGLVALALFALVRYLDGYGNLGLALSDHSPWRWLQVNKYPPSLAFILLELGVMALILAAFCRLRTLDPLVHLGRAALWFYLLHAHLLALGRMALGCDYVGPAPFESYWAAYLGAGLVVGLLYPTCLWFRRYKRDHPRSWARWF